MEKKEFISKLRITLIKRGFKPSVIDNEMRSVNGFFESNNISDVQISVKEMADEITEMLKEKETPAESGSALEEMETALRANGAEFAGSDNDQAQTPADNSADENPGTAEVVNEETPAVPAIADENPSDAAAVDENSEQPASDEPDSESDEDVKIAGSEIPAEEKTSADEGTDLGVEEFNPEDYKPKDDIDDEKAAGFIGKIIKKFKETAKKTAAKTAQKKAEKDSNYIPEETASYDNDHSKLIFWILFSIALPFMIALALIMIALYIAFWVVLALIMIFFIAGLIAFVFAGVLVALIGIIYGVIMVIKGEAPIGLFEIGLGITVGSVVMFIGILVYNFAIRLIPFCMKMLAKLLTFAFKRAKEGLGAIKRMLQTV